MAFGATINLGNGRERHFRGSCRGPPNSQLYSFATIGGLIPRPVFRDSPAVRTMRRPTSSKIVGRTGPSYALRTLATDRGAVPRCSRATTGVAADVHQRCMRRGCRAAAGDGVAAIARRDHAGSFLETHSPQVEALGGGGSAGRPATRPRIELCLCSALAAWERSTAAATPG